MNTSPSLAEQKQRAFDAAREGRLEDAARLLKPLVAADPGDVGLLLLNGDVMHATGRRAEASRSYSVALARAPQLPAEAARAYAGGLSRAQDRLAGYAKEYAAVIDATIPAAQRTPRFAESVDILLGRAPIHLQQPTRYYYPGLPQLPIYPTAMFPWARDLEARTPEIRRELLGVMGGAGMFEPYLPREDGQPHVRSHRLVGNPAWSAFYLWKDGKRIEENCQLCPVTAEAISKVPLDHLEGQAPSVLFSLLKPDTHIPPHHGLINTRLICHLPLLVPGPAWLRVGNQRHAWREGELLVFDDSFEHEAMNEASETRVVLLFDVWRPELSETERAEVAALLGAIRLGREVGA